MQWTPCSVVVGGFGFELTDYNRGWWGGGGGSKMGHADVVFSQTKIRT